MMKKILMSVALLTLFAMGGMAQEAVRLPQPDLSLGTTLTEALQKRRSDRMFQVDKPVTDKQLSLLLWAACGINRPDKGLLTIPTAINAQDIEVYVCTAKGVSLYNPKANTLTPVTDQDIRLPLAERQENMATAPVFLLIVSDLSRFRSNAEHYGAMDAGYASQNICLMAAALGLKTVPRAMMNRKAVVEALGLKETPALELNHPIGY